MKSTQAPTRVVARIVPNDSGTGTASRPSLPSRVTKKVSTLLIGLMVVFMCSMGVSGGAAPASAWGFDDIVDEMKALFCFGEVDQAPSPFSSNSDGALIGARAPESIKGGYSNDSVTAYEEYGTSGLFWSEYRPAKDSETADGETGCLTNNFGPFLNNMMANEMFSFTTETTSITIGMFRWASNGDLLDSFTKPLNCVIEGCNGGKGLKTTLFLNYLMPIVMLGALWGAWNGLVKKRTTETAQGGLWMVGATAFALIFMANPGWVAEKSNAFVGEISSTIMNGVTTATSTSVGKDDMCYVTGKEKGTRMAACSMYKAMLVTPWSAGQFGVPLGAELEGSESVKIGNRSTKDVRVVQIEAQTVSHTELESGDSYETIKDRDADRWMSVKDDVWDGIGSGRNKASKMMWAGEQSGERFQIALASIVAAVALGILVILISFSTVVLAVGMILLIMMAPLFLLIGVHPGFGRGIALKWLELLLGTVIKRIVLSAVLAILVGMYQVILEQPDLPWFSQVALIMALGVGAIIFRKPLLETLNVINLGGTRTGMEQGLDRSGKKGVSAVGGAVAGGVAAGASGGLGSVLGGAVKGGMMGSRSGSPVRAATMGSAAGRRVGNRNATQDKQAERQEEAQKAKQAEEIQARIDRDPFDPDAWKELEKWNKKNPKHQVDKPEGGGSTPYPQSAKEAKEMEEQRRARTGNGGGGSGGAGGGGGTGAGPRPQPAPGGGAGPRPQPAPVAPAGGGVPTTPPNSGGGQRPAGGGVPTTPPNSGAAPSRPGGAPASGAPADPNTGTGTTGGTPGGAGPRPAGGTGNPPRPQGR